MNDIAKEFMKVVDLIQKARENAIRKVNEELILLYWEFVSPLVTQISWTNHLLILSSTKTDDEKEFYIKLCIKEKYSKRELQK